MGEPKGGTLDELVDLQRGTTYRSRLLGQPGPVLLGLASIQRNGGFRSDSLKTYGGESPPKLILRDGDIYVSLKDVTQAGDLLGAVSRVPRDIAAGRLTQDTVKLIFKRDTPRSFLYWVLRAPQYRDYCRARAIGTTNLSLTRADFLAFPVSTPSSRQLLLVELLDTIDDKVELNRRMNETLEAIARTLFTSWFVDFDAVRAKAEGRDPGLPSTLADLFPDSFEGSELGEIPKGWRVTSLGDLCRRVAMGPFGSDIRTDNFVASGVPVVRGGNLKSGFVDEGFVFVSETKADELRSANAFPGNIVITHRGTLGQVGLIPKPSLFPRYVVSQSQMLLSVNPDLATPRYIFEYLRSPVGQHALLASTSSTGVPAIARPTSSLRAVRLPQPPLPVLATFERILDPFIARGNRARQEIRTLTSLRDTLLPKLISGELPIKDAERIVGDVS